MCVHVRPASADLYDPSPEYELRALYDSPVPTQTTFGADGATATAPIDDTFWLSKIGSKVVPLFVVFQTPPFRVAT